MDTIHDLRRWATGVPDTPEWGAEITVEIDEFRTGDIEWAIHAPGPIFAVLECDTVKPGCWSVVNIFYRVDGETPVYLPDGSLYRAICDAVEDRDQTEFDILYYEGLGT